MSSVKLQGGASGAGSVALVAPNTNSVRSLTLPDFDGLLIGSASAGTAGQVLTSAGPGATPTWESVTGTGSVTSVDVSGGATGMTFYGGPITTSGTITLAGTLAVAYGGTGTTTSTGTGSVVLSESPMLVTPHLGTPSAVDLANASNLSLISGVTGTLPVANGGTGTTMSTGTGSVVLSESPTFTGTVSGASLSLTEQLALGAAAPIYLNGWPGTAGQVLTSAGPGTTPTWTTPTTGTVTSVDVSGADTGLNFYGGPITGAGTITLYGTLAVAYGGTGTTTSTGTGSVVLANSPTFTGTVSGASLSLTEQLGVGSAPLTGVTLTTYNGFPGTPVATGTDVTGVNSRFQSAGVALDMGVYSSGSCFLQTRLVSDHSSMFTLALNPLGGSVLVGTSVYFSNQLVTGDSGTTVTINFNASQKQALVLTANCTIFTIFPGIGNYQLLLAQDSTGGRTVTWGGSVQYVGSATAPAINTVANGYTMVSIYWNGSSAWLAASKVNA